MYDPEEQGSEYVLHKIKLENYIKKHVQLYSIFRISQIIAIAKNQTLINFLINSIEHNLPFAVWKRATRNLVAIDDVFAIINYMLQNELANNKTINLANQSSISIFDLIAIIEKRLNLKANMIILDKGKPYDKILIDDISSILDILDINFDTRYYERAIEQLFVARLKAC